MKPTQALSISILWAIMLFATIQPMAAQQPKKPNKKTVTQNIEGRIVDKETKQALAGVIVFAEDTYPVISTTTDLDGFFQLERVPIGRQTIKAQKGQYHTFYTDNLLIRPAKEIYLEIEMRKTPGNDQISAVTTDNRENIPLNEFSAVSTRSFTVEETQRYPGSINDPGRMALGFAGVQSYQDNESDVIIRGNSISGTLFRLEGLDLLGIGHFAWPLSSNGAISAFSISLLNDSDLSTGAFAAEYGNATAGVFDMHFRKGNRNNREYTFRLGLIGIDFATEGPIKKGNSSYLLNYRYSTLGLFSNLGFYVVRPNVANTFQDLSFNTTFESDDRKNMFSFFGMGGLGSEQWYVKDTADWVTRLDFNRINYRTLMGTVGFTYTRLLDDKSYLKILLGGNINQLTNNRNNAMYDSIRVETNEYMRHQYTLSGTYSRKFNNIIRLKAGLNGHVALFNMFNTNYNYFNTTNDTLIQTDGLKWTTWLQGYAQASFHFSRRISLNAGVHALYLMLNKTYSVEPRLSLQYQLAKKSRVSLAYGLHGQILPWGVYLFQQKDSSGNITLPNKDLPMSKSHHAVLAFRQLVGQDMSFQVELWYQQLFNQPVAVDTGNTFYLFNQRENYGLVPLSSAGTGRNYGIDITFERSFRKGFFLIVSSSIFRSTYKASNGREYRTRFDNLFTGCATLGKEFNFKNGNSLSMGLRLMVNGGLRYTPVNDSLSQQYNMLVLNNSQPYTMGQFNEKVPFYYRSDVRLAYRKDWPKFSFMVSFDAQNITNNTGNVFQILYNVQQQDILKRYHSGILPVISMQLDF